MISYFFQPLDVIENNGYITILGYDNRELILFMNRRWKTSRISNNMFITITKKKLVFHSFFALEFLFILQTAYREEKGRSRFIGNRNILFKLIELMSGKTWLRNLGNEPDSKLNINKLTELTYTPREFQKEFINDIYLQNKFHYNLDGYLLSFEPGMGKTYTSIGLMHCLNKDTVIIICPKSTIDDTWIREINGIYKTPQRIWASNSNTPLTVDYKFYIVNYESMDKLYPLLEKLTDNNVGIIADECHNFKDMNSVRSQILYNIKSKLKCNDILLMSGTPIKALGKEMIPILKLLDRLFIPMVEDRFKAIFGQSVPIANEIMCHRLGKFMHRKLKSDVLTLPPKEIIDYKITIPDGEIYTLKKVKDAVELFRAERVKYYNTNFDLYLSKYNRCLKEFESTLISSQDLNEYNKYRKNIEYLRKYGHTNPEAKDIIIKTNSYEKNTIIPALSGQSKKDFVTSKSVVKYVELKILGEILGGLLNRMRSEMFQKMISHSNITNIINESIKKTVCFTTYVDVADITYSYLKGNKYKPLLVKSETSKNIKDILKEFKENNEVNPIIATIQTLSTGVTLVDANTVIFLNVPWRSVDFDQASDRVHRIGQDTDVFIYKFILDTGNEDNLSTRMESILQWSKSMFDSIVDGIEVDNLTNKSEPIYIEISQTISSVSRQIIDMYQ